MTGQDHTALLRQTLARVREFERTHVPTVPKPVLHNARGESLETQAADRITAFAGSMRFVYLHMGWFALWILINIGVFAALGFFGPFDVFPFGLLTLIVSLEAIFLNTFVLLSQNRQADLADKRAEADYEVNVRAEREIASVRLLLEAMAQHMVDSHDLDGSVVAAARQIIDAGAAPSDTTVVAPPPARPRRPAAPRRPKDAPPRPGD